MQRLRRPALGGLLVAAVVLAGCSDPAPSEVPSPSGTAPTSAAAPTSSGAPTETAAATPSAAETPSTSTEPSDGAGPEVEPSRPVETAPPKKLDESTKTAGATVSLVSVRATTVEARAPGDRSGPGVLVRLKLVNATGKTLDTSFTQVGVTDEAGTAATLVDGPPTDALAASVRAGRSVQGTYAFLMDDPSAGPVTVSVYVTSGQPVVTFRGRPS